MIRRLYAPAGIRKWNKGKGSVMGTAGECWTMAMKLNRVWIGRKDLKRAMLQGRDGAPGGTLSGRNGSKGGDKHCCKVGQKFASKDQGVGAQISLQLENCASTVSTGTRCRKIKRLKCLKVLS